MMASEVPTAKMHARGLRHVHDGEDLEQHRHHDGAAANAEQAGKNTRGKARRQQGDDQP